MTDRESCDSPINRLSLGCVLLAEYPGVLGQLAPMPLEEPDELVRRLLPGEER